MTTPVADFVRAYIAANPVRLHMPGHKGTGPLGCEGLDITEIPGADALYEADGILAQSEANATALFGTRRTFYSTEGSSQCVRAMLALALWQRPADAVGRPVIVAARNVHKSFLYAAALLDLDVVWLYPDGGSRSICACDVSPEALERMLADVSPCAVYLTTPDYLGGQCDVAALAAVCHRHGTLLLVDNAHGAYLKFLSPSQHPMDLGADLCCDSAHKTLPVLTGGAYLHVSRCAPAGCAENGKRALALFGSTSPSYLILQSLDLCNAQLAADWPERLRETVRRLEVLREQLREHGWVVSQTDPLKVTLDCAASGWDGRRLAAKLREHRIECEYADRDDLVLMATPDNPPEDLSRLLAALGTRGDTAPLPRPLLPCVRAEQAVTIREGMLRPHVLVPAEQALGRICAAPTVACPPAIPIAVTGERITADAVALFARYGIEQVEVLA
jgi:arginine/lysine/ornithine decarboxylase